ncbi:hypothetical protein ACRALDRAFT_2024434 [Sodiomyces alcalophilus JCM 7366]|uniref:uncharacterized protein n=1 Tax=Sodiomyces alcalophilus JCM 7366 TaxID=591952 RepID=UPI0039B6D0E0
MSEAEGELNERFTSGTEPLDPSVLAELQSIMRLHDVSVEDLFYKWESYCIKMDYDAATLSLDPVRGFKQHIQDSLENATRGQPQTQVKTKTERRSGATPRAPRGDVFAMLDGLVPNTPGSGSGTGRPSKRRNLNPYDTPSISRVKGDLVGSSPDYKTPSRMEEQLNAMQSPSSFNDRSNPGEVLEVLNDHLQAPEPPICPYPESRIKLTAASDQKKLAYKPLAMKLSEASEILDDRIDEFIELTLQYHSLDLSAIGSAAHQSPNPVIAVGRIASDSPEGKLNAASLILETSRRTGGGQRVALDMTKVHRFSFFPGQIVALRGINTSGHAFVVHEILELPMLPNAASTREALSSHRTKLRGDPDAMDSDDAADPPPLNVLFAAGPYTADDNLDFEPLHALCSRAADTLADAVVLVGPFIDAEHPLVATGDFDLPIPESEQDTATMNTVFRHLFAPALHRLSAANPSVTILLVPSVRDVIDKHVSWPQDAPARRELGLPKTARFVSNPMTVSLNETVLGVSSQDILWELRHEELVVAPARDPVTLSRLCRYLLEQRHYFPLFPATDRSRLPRTGTTEAVPPGAMLDVSYLKLGEMVNVRPDVMIIPSFLPPFAKVIESVLVINPGTLSKRRGAGTYARMALYPPSFEEGSESLLSHRVFDRARVEITRI